jgi:acetolactate synthase regulatory subunit
MQWLLSLETDLDPIAACRLMNIFRRKGLRVGTLTLAAQAAGYSLMAVVESPEAEVEHVFNFLRRSAGVRHVEYYRHEPTADAAFLFIDAAPNAASVAKFMQTFPEARMIFAGNGKYLLEVPSASRPRRAAADLGAAGFLPFARVRTTRDSSQYAAAQVS